MQIVLKGRVIMNDNYLKKELYDLVKTNPSIFDFIQSGSLDGMWYWDLENAENEWNRFFKASKRQW